MVVDDSQGNTRKYTALPSLHNVVRKHGLAARKSLGQHFLLDRNITDKILRISGDVSGLHLCEVGPGPGGLTRALLASDAASVTVVEKDVRFLPALEELRAHHPDKFRILHEDALDCDLRDYCPPPRAVLANLPYNVGTALLVQWLEALAQDPTSYRFLTLMFQKEVADRLLASPSSKHYGRLSVLTQWICNVERLFDLPASAFTPPPKVASTVVQLTPLPKPRFPADKIILEQTLASAFGQRRKMLRSSLASCCAYPQAWLEAAGIDPTRRAETLSIEEFCRLASCKPA